MSERYIGPGVRSHEERELFVGKRRFLHLTNTGYMPYDPESVRIWNQNYELHWVCLMEVGAVTIPEARPVDENDDPFDPGIAVYRHDQLEKSEVYAVSEWLEQHYPTYFGDYDTMSPLELGEVRELVAQAMEATGLNARLDELGIGREQ